MNDILVYNYPETKDKENIVSEAHKNHITINKHEDNYLIKPKKLRVSEHSLYEEKEKEYSSTFQKKKILLENDLSLNQCCLSETNNITSDKILKINEIMGNEQKILERPQVKGKKQTVVKCLESSMKILKKISKDFIKGSEKINPDIKIFKEDSQLNVAILEESKKRMEIYKSLFKNIKDIFQEIKGKIKKNTHLKDANSDDENIDDEDVNEEGYTNIKDYGLNEDGGDSINEFTLPNSKKLHDEYDSCDLPEYIIQEESVKKPISSMNKFNNKLSTVEQDIDCVMQMENTIQQFDVNVTRTNTNFFTKHNMKINYDMENCYFFREKENYENCWKTEGKNHNKKNDFYEIIRKNQKKEKDCSIF